ncbi:tRNA (5-methylaminomethyl-2-thiouridine)(34)-methyltransferase MnmD [Sphingobacterium daejeonense]|uniref:tRNA (5-methylaminomethyl-2-thiouridine)(34)-methyltransferase MnmD n=1 Tax=Sphingobacterium daejeonense TaxID=371142 RepID=UPI0010C3B82E|nr:tRNA (5-methylaminomethyl-2-thiouridine)(34)-methyltransferase MnmD [Sphingobacterium daejeonense]VTP90982.1 tRNA 5-methylaminomethyl-2-thiouridine biosynthesis bifunctional protein MnmC [Sphingobacterium daejeonense]
MEFVKTADGSKTLYHDQVGEHYHSKHGAQQESIHVFLNTGLRYWLDKESSQSASILEIGFGTGLNFLLTADYCSKNNVNLNYIGIEAYPLKPELIVQSEYNQYVNTEIWDQFVENYAKALESKLSFNELIQLEIAHQKVMDFQSEERFDVIYFDAFAEIHQPEMWTPETLAHVCQFLRPGGVFVTYAITGNLKRAMKALGFSIEKAPGAPGKREMLRATKL